MGTKHAIDQLSSLPQVLIRILDTIHDDRADAQSIAKIVRYDPVNVAKLIDVANSGAYGGNRSCASINDAVSLLGTDTVKTIVAATARRQFFNHVHHRSTQFVKAHWLRSLFTAHLALELSFLATYRSPDEAYLTGLLAEIERLALATKQESTGVQASRATHGDSNHNNMETEGRFEDHCTPSADLLVHLQTSTFVADAIRYRHEKPAAIEGAHQLIKLIKLATLLSERQNQVTESADEELKESHRLLGVNDALTEDLVLRISEDLERIASDFGVDQGEENDADRQAWNILGGRLSVLADIRQVSRDLSTHHKDADSQQALQRSLLTTFDLKKSLLFLHGQDQQVLEACLPNQQNSGADFKIPLKKHASVISDCYLKRSFEMIDANKETTIVDRQLMEYFSTGNLFCVPLIHQQQLIGVLAFGHSNLRREEFEKLTGFVRLLAAEVSRNIVSNQATSSSTVGTFANQSGVDIRVLEAVHEISNPLTIIFNYLELLRRSLGENHKDNEKLEHIKGEIEGIRKILMRLSSPNKSEHSADKLHHVIRSLASIFHDSIPEEKKISIVLNLDKEAESVLVNVVLFRQVLTNLLKNATEALQTKGRILIATESNISVGGKLYTAIYVQDDGPGIPPDLRPLMFSPVNSSKGVGHSGLGLSIVKKIVDEMDGIIVCRNNINSVQHATGTQFQILLPTSHKAEMNS